MAMAFDPPADVRLPKPKGLWIRMVQLLFATCVGLCLGGVARAQSKPTLDDMIGQMLFMGMGDMRVFEAESALAADVRAGYIGGLIVYEKNLSNTQTRAGLIALIDGFQACAPTPLWIGIDEEGGQVSRLKTRYGFMNTYSAAALGQGHALHTYEVAEKMAKQMLSLGVNVNFAPVVDLALNPHSAVIAGARRSFGTEPTEVVAHARAFIRAHNQYGVLCVVKHFPGHGSAEQDTHNGWVDVSRTWQPQELIPYQQLVRSGDLAAVMTAHVVHTGMDPSAKPATLSKPILQHKLRRKLKYRHLIFSDDLQMNAIQHNYTLEESLYYAIDAGVDVLVFSNHAPHTVRARDVQQRIRQLVDSARLSPVRIQRSYARIMEAKTQWMANKDFDRR